MGRIMLGPWPVRARCPACGEVTSNERLGVMDVGRRLRCKSCGTEWTWVAGSRRTQLSEAERMAARQDGERREPVTCVVCGREFVPRKGGQACCSRQCYERARYGGGRSGLLLLAAQARKLDAAMREVT